MTLRASFACPYPEAAKEAAAAGLREVGGKRRRLKTRGEGRDRSLDRERATVQSHGGVELLPAVAVAGPGSLRTSLSLGPLGGEHCEQTDRHGVGGLCAEPSSGSVFSTFSTVDEGYEQLDTGGSENIRRRHSDGGGDGVTSLDGQTVGGDGGGGGGGGDTEMRPETPPATPETAGRDIRMNHARHVIHSILDPQLNDHL